jgi:hypothetical protein
MEQQRLFAWSETSGLLDLDKCDDRKVLASNTFSLHRTTVLDLLVQVQCLFKEFQDYHKVHENLKPVEDRDSVLENPEKDAASANTPLPARRRDFIRKAMLGMKEKYHDGFKRLKWVTFDKEAFEILLGRFSILNDNMTDILDAQMQVQIRDTVQDTNRGVLQLHHRVADLSRLVMALNIKLEANNQTNLSTMSKAQRAANADGLQQLSKLAKFKAFNESIESEKQAAWDEATGMCLELGKPTQNRGLLLDRNMIELEQETEESYCHRCEAILHEPDGTRKKVWIEWKEYDSYVLDVEAPPKKVILDRVGKLAALLNHSPKPEAFRTPHCLGYFDRASETSEASAEDSDDDILNQRLGLVFERPVDDNLHTTLPLVSLRELLDEESRPRVTDRVSLAHAIARCLLYLHAVNWLHKGLRSHNIVFFRTRTGHVDYAKPYLSGFDFSRPARPEEMTDTPGDDAEHNFYRHPLAQTSMPDETAGQGGECGRRERFKKSFDIYSLGVLLVEISHWKPIEKVLNIDVNRARGRPSIALRIRDSLLAEERAAELGAQMGGMFEDATMTCITGGSRLGLEEGGDETHDEVVGKLSERFFEAVVKKLGDIRV